MYLISRQFYTFLISNFQKSTNQIKELIIFTILFISLFYLKDEPKNPQTNKQKRVTFNFLVYFMNPSKI